MSSPFVELKVKPATVELKPGETQAFQAYIDDRTPAGNVTWTIAERDFGTVVPESGIYSAPYRVFRARRLTIVASQRDPEDDKKEIGRGSGVIDIDASRSWTPIFGAGWLALFFAIVFFLLRFWPSLCLQCGPRGLLISPPVVTLTRGEAQQFLTNAPVTWTNTVNLAGLYIAPSTIDTEQLVTVTATDKADAQQSAVGVVHLSPAAGLTVFPSRVEVPFGGKVQLSASMTGTQAKSTWLQPAAGTISADGVYQAPSRGEPQAIVVLAEAQISSTPPTAPLLAGALVSLVRTELSPCEYPGSSFWRLLLLVAGVGALGGLTHAMGSFGTYVGNRELKASWLWWYGLKPALSASVAILVFLAVRAGLGVPGIALEAADCFKVAGFAGLVGLFAEPATVKLKDVFEAIFTPRRDPREDKSGQAEVSTSPVIRSIEPRTLKASEKTKLQIGGSKFAEGCAVQIGGQGFATRRPSSSALEVDVPANALKPGTHSLVVSNRPPDGSLSQPETISVEA
jgi:hypothetical protein